MFRDDKFDSIEVSTSHLKLRTVCFILALLLALGGFGYGVSQLIRKEPGYYEIKPNDEDDASQYKTGITFMYYLEGSSNVIGAQLNRLKEVYSTALLRAYKLLDEESEYEGYGNIALLNASVGERVAVGEQLFGVLSDAWEKTREEKGYNMFAGALFCEWNSILSLDDAAEFDPANNADMARRLKTLAEKTADLENFGLKFYESDWSVELWISPEYLDFLGQNGYSGSVLDLNLLSEAYRLALVRDELEVQGFDNGYIYTESGLTLSLSGHEGGEYCVYGPAEGGAEVIEKVEAKPDSASSLFHAFEMVEGEIMYYTVETPGGTLHRHPCFVTSTGEFAEVLASSCTVRYDGDIVGACYSNIALYNLTDRTAVCAAAKETDGTVVCAFWDGSVFQNG